MKVRLTQLDGKLPNLALARLAACYRARGADITFTRSPYRQLTEPDHYDAVFGSAIFSFSVARVQSFQQQFPDAIVGGTWDTANPITLEDLPSFADHGLDYSLWPDFSASIGFTQRGCRLKCGFCVVPRKEGHNHRVATIADIYRGAPWPKHLHLLDNDFFGQDAWQERIAEIRHGRFKVCLNQGINVRMIDDDSAAALASIDYRDDSFTTKRLYTAWDNLGDEDRFFRGMAILARHGIPGRHVMAFCLIGYDKRETWERVFHRVDRMLALDIQPYPMIFDPVVNRYKQLPAGAPRYQTLVDRRMTLGQLQRWLNGRYYRVTSFADYVRTTIPLAHKDAQLALTL